MLGYRLWLSWRAVKWTFRLLTHYEWEAKRRRKRKMMPYIGMWVNVRLKHTELTANFNTHTHTHIPKQGMKRKEAPNIVFIVVAAAVAARRMYSRISETGFGCFTSFFGCTIEYLYRFCNSIAFMFIKIFIVFLYQWQ